MLRKKTLYILFGLTAIFIVIAIVAVGYPVLADETIYLPIISGPDTNANSADVDERPMLVEIVATPVWRDDIEAPISRVREQAEELKRVVTEQPKDILYVGGPETRGALIEVAGKKLQLPPDAQMGGEVVAGHCLSGNCVRPPFYLIERGEQRAILKHDGSIYRAQTELEQEDYDIIFSFLHDTFGPFRAIEESE